MNKIRTLVEEETPVNIPTFISVKAVHFQAAAEERYADLHSGVDSAAGYINGDGHIQHL